MLKERGPLARIGPMKDAYRAERKANEIMKESKLYKKEAYALKKLATKLGKLHNKVESAVEKKNKKISALEEKARMKGVAFSQSYSRLSNAIQVPNVSETANQYEKYAKALQLSTENAKRWAKIKKKRLF